LKALADCRVLVVEDEVLIAMAVEQLLSEQGCTVIGPVGSVLRALRLIGTNEIDAAVLDVNLGREKVFPVADALADANVPFVLLTGHTGDLLPEAHRERPIVVKPFNPSELVASMLTALAR
jgi:DNA-binding response OmpR family regulator